MLGAEFTKVYAQEHGSRAASRAMQMTEATAAQGQPAEGPANAGAAAARPPGQEAPRAAEPTAVPAAARLVENREKIQDAEPPAPLPRGETALAGVSALAGVIAVAMVRRRVHRRRAKAAAAPG